MAAQQRPKTRCGFEIAIICTYQVEANAIEALLDADYEEDGFSYGKAPGDTNGYTMGRLGAQDVVVAFQFVSKTSIPSSGDIAKNLTLSFPAIKLVLLVGVCGLAPKADDGSNVKLGDIVISWKVGRCSYESNSKGPKVKDWEYTLHRAKFGAVTEAKIFMRKLHSIKAVPRMESKIPVYAQRVALQKGMEDAKYPGWTNDNLFHANHVHKHRKPMMNGKPCPKCSSKDKEVCDRAAGIPCVNLGCTKWGLIHRDVKTLEPRIFFGAFGLSTCKIKSGVDRDELMKKEGVRGFGFDQKQRGPWYYYPTIIVKAGSNYADGHRNVQWPKYAAATAAACAKAMLELWRRSDAQGPDDLEDVSSTTVGDVSDLFEGSPSQAGTGPSTSASMGNASVSGQGKLIFINQLHAQNFSSG